MKKRMIRRHRLVIRSAAIILAGLTVATVSSHASAVQETERVIISVGGSGGLLNHRSLPTVRTPHGYQGEALRLHNRYLHAGLTKRNVFRSSRQFSPFGNVFRSSRHYQQKLASSIDARPLRTIGHPIRVIGNDIDTVTSPSFIAGGAGYGGHFGTHLSPFDAGHHYYDAALYAPEPYYGHYQPDTSHYGPSNYINKSDYIDDEQRAPATPQRRTPVADEQPLQQAVTISVKRADGSRRIVITSEPIPALLESAWEALAGGDDAGAAEQFGRLINPGGHATDLSRQAKLGQIIAQSASTLDGQVSPDVAASWLRDALADDPNLLSRLPENADLNTRIAALAERMERLAETSASAESYAALADAMRQLGNDDA